MVASISAPSWESLAIKQTGQGNLDCLKSYPGLLAIEFELVKATERRQRHSALPNSAARRRVARPIQLIRIMRR